MGEHVNDALLHQRAKAHRRAHVVTENQERAAIRAQAVMERYSVGNPCHGVLAHTKAEIQSIRRVLLKVVASFDVGLIRGREIGGASDEKSDARCDGVEHLPARCTGGELLSGLERRHVRIPVLRKIARLPTLILLSEIGKLGAIALQELIPLILLLRTLFERLFHVLPDVGRHKKLLILRPTQVALRQQDFLLTQRLAVRRGRVLLVGTAISDKRSHDDQRRPLRFRLRLADRAAKCAEVIAIFHPRDMPAVRLEARIHILRK